MFNEARTRSLWVPSMETHAFSSWFDNLRHVPAQARISMRINRLIAGHTAVIAVTLGDIARVKGMTQIARDSGLGRESLCKAEMIRLII